MFIDSHCHIDKDEVLLRAFDAGVKGVLNAGSDLDNNLIALEMAEKYDNVWTSVGIHPDSVVEKIDKIRVEDIVEKSKHPKVIAIGECGLDYHYGFDVKDVQKEMFLRHIKASMITKLPLMIHHRDAEDDMIEMLSKAKSEYCDLKGVIHCFTASKEFAKAVYDLGFYISASGIITFKSAQSIVEVFEGFDRERVLIETDCPYLAPVPYRGKENEPAYVVKTAEKLAQIWGVSVDKVAEITSNNFFRLYQKAL